MGLGFCSVAFSHQRPNLPQFLVAWKRQKERELMARERQEGNTEVQGCGETRIIFLVSLSSHPTYTHTKHGPHFTKLWPSLPLVSQEFPSLPTSLHPSDPPKAKEAGPASTRAPFYRFSNSSKRQIDAAKAALQSVRARPSGASPVLKLKARDGHHLPGPGRGSAGSWCQPHPGHRSPPSPRHNGCQHPEVSFPPHKPLTWTLLVPLSQVRKGSLGC